MTMIGGDSELDRSPCDAGTCRTHGQSSRRRWWLKNQWRATKGWGKSCGKFAAVLAASDGRGNGKPSEYHLAPTETQSKKKLLQEDQKMANVLARCSSVTSLCPSEILKTHPMATGLSFAKQAVVATMSAKTVQNLFSNSWALWTPAFSFAMKR